VRQNSRALPAGKVSNNSRAHHNRPVHRRGRGNLLLALRHQARRSPTHCRAHRVRRRRQHPVQHPASGRGLAQRRLRRGLDGQAWRVPRGRDSRHCRKASRRPIRRGVNPRLM
jgi:hypothetical protein